MRLIFAIFALLTPSAEILYLVLVCFIRAEHAGICDFVKTFSNFWGFFTLFILRKYHF